MSEAAPATTPGAAGPFSGRAVIALVLLVSVSLVASWLLGAFGEAVTEPASYQADGYSRSAVGHRAFLALLRALGRPATVSRYRTADKAEGSALLVLEPRVGDGTAEQGLAADVAEKARRLLLVLPKRAPAPDLVRRGWIAGAAPVELADAQRALDAFGVQGTVVRADHSAAWTGPLPAPTLDGPQLVRSGALTPLVGTADGMVAGELRGGGRHVVVVADPDLLETHGLGKGRNAELAVALVERLAGAGVPLVVDETLHGHLLTPSLGGELLTFPLVLVALQLALVTALVVWAALVRFGRPRAAPPALDAGKALLIANTADLLRAGGHLAEVVRAYLRGAREGVLARLPPPGSAEEPAAWLARLEAARGRTGALRRLQQRVTRLEKKRHAEPEALRVAQQIHRWREELTDGAHGDPRPRRVAQG